MDLLSPPVEAVAVEPTPEVIRRGASAEGVPQHSHVPAPRPKSMRGDEEWLLVLAGAEDLIRWKKWTQPHPLPLDAPPGECLGSNGHTMHDSKGVGIWPDRRYASWPTLLRGLRAQREAEPHIADARDLAHAYWAVEQYDRFYVRDGGEAVSSGRDSWREDVAVPWLANLKQIVVELSVAR